MILISRCYSEITQESAECGDYSDMGFIVKDEPIAFRDLIELMKRHPYYEGRWLSTGWDIKDIKTGVEREETLHYSHSNLPRSKKYWRWALRAAGHIKSPNIIFEEV